MSSLRCGEISLQERSSNWFLLMDLVSALMGGGNDLIENFFNREERYDDFMAIHFSELIT